jgi:hypothetical protein
VELSFPVSWLKVARIALLVTSALLFCWTVYRIWKQAVPVKVPEAETGPSAIKGCMAFTDEDGELFRRLSRKTEIENLLTHLLDDQIPMVVLMGESGVGKTSLLRAGISDGLKKRNVRLIYWEALPSNPSDRLLHAIQSSWDCSDDPAVPENLGDAIKALSAGPNRTVTGRGSWH